MSSKTIVLLLVLYIPLHRIDCLLSHNSRILSGVWGEITRKLGIVLDGQHFIINVQIGVGGQFSCHKQLFVKAVANGMGQDGKGGHK